MLLSCATSLDGYIDDAKQARLVLSGAADLDRVDEVRAGSDAILVGAGTIRADNPRLLLRSPAWRAARIARGVAPDPVKATLTNSGDLDPDARFFTTGEAAKIVYASSRVVAEVKRRLGNQAEVVDGADPVDLTVVLTDLVGRGVERLMVEGGSSVLTQFLVGELADELQLAIAPFFVGDSTAPRLVGDGRFPWSANRPARLADVARVGGEVVLTYALSDRFVPSGGVH